MLFFFSYWLRAIYFEMLLLCGFLGTSGNTCFQQPSLTRHDPSHHASGLPGGPMTSEVLVNTVAHSLPPQRQRAQPPPAAAAPAEHLRSSLILCGTCPAHDSSTVRVFSISQFLCFAQFLLLGVSAVLSVNKKNSISMLEFTVGEKDI